MECTAFVKEFLFVECNIASWRFWQNILLRFSVTVMTDEILYEGRLHAYLQITYECCLQAKNKYKHGGGKKL
jgi:hypothetical protein